MAVVGGRVLTKMAGTTWLTRMNFVSSFPCLQYLGNIGLTECFYKLPFQSHAMFCTFVLRTLWFMCNIHARVISLFPSGIHHLQFHGGFPPG